MSTLNKLERAVMDSIKDNLADSPYYIEEVLQHGCISGMVSELIYYTDTTEWFDAYEPEIMTLVKEYMEQIGENDVCAMFADKIDFDDMLNRTTQFKNVLAWFSYEETVRELSQTHCAYFRALGAEGVDYE